MKVGYIGIDHIRANAILGHAFLIRVALGAQLRRVQQELIRARIGNVMHTMAIDADGNLYVADAMNNRVRKISFK